jgi:hypothetical protein
MEAISCTLTRNHSVPTEHKRRYTSWGFLAVFGVYLMNGFGVWMFRLLMLKSSENRGPEDEGFVFFFILGFEAGRIILIHVCWKEKLQVFQGKGSFDRFSKLLKECEQ